MCKSYFPTQIARIFPSTYYIFLFKQINSNSTFDYYEAREQL